MTINLKIQNYKVVGTRPRNQIENIVIHHTAGNPDLEVPIMSDPDYGYHFGITKTGQIMQYAPITNVVQHIHNLNKTSVGICVHGNFEKTSPPNVQVLAVIELCSYLLTQCENASVYGHSELPQQSTACPGKFLLAKLPEIRSKSIIASSKDEGAVSSWAVDAQTTLMKLGVTDGTNPKDLVSREQAWAMLYRMYECIKSSREDGK